ncbi:MAG: GPP34 family phosphoprotein [Bifidobacteriaceae bacterium]|jgi:hypothetical protein|nr:GPP34 family phosphoprotein [Bifidobacteriaceae bacterium]
MQSLSFTQEYFLCALNPKGKAPLSLEGTFQACVLAGGIAELLDRGYFTLGQKDRLTPGLPWDGGLPHLVPLHAAIASSRKPPTAKDLADRYVVMSGKLGKELFASFGQSLVAAGCATRSTEPGWFGEKARFAPRPQAVTRVIERVRAEVLEAGPIDDQTICLIALLDKSKLLKQYFSKVERGMLRERLRQARATGPYKSVGRVVDHVETMVAAIVTVIVVTAPGAS